LRAGIRPESIRPMAAAARQGIADNFGVALPGAVA
jgi:hypothetical protein